MSSPAGTPHGACRRGAKVWTQTVLSHLHTPPRRLPPWSAGLDADGVVPPEYAPTAFAAVERRFGRRLGCPTRTRPHGACRRGAKVWTQTVLSHPHAPPRRLPPWSKGLDADGVVPPAHAPRRLPPWSAGLDAARAGPSCGRAFTARTIRTRGWCRPGSRRPSLRRSCLHPCP